MLRRALLAAVLTVAAAVFAFASPAQARFCKIDHQCYLTFYSDNTYTTVVGYDFTNCVGDVVSHGVRSSYQTFDEIPC
jgi:hypothetical protein